MRFSVNPMVFRSGSAGEVKITLTEPGVAFSAGEYYAHIVPSYNFHITRRNEAEFCPAIPCRAQGESLSFSYAFGKEQEYRVKIFQQGTGARVLETSVYAVDEDLYAQKPLMADFHLHTTVSDGRQDPEEVCCAYCAAGFEAIAVTDHDTMDGSRKARAVFGGLPLPMQIFFGEEVQTCQKNHLINFGEEDSVNDWYRENEEQIKERVRLRAQSIEVPEGVDAYEAAALEMLSERLRKNGGISVYVHPMWRSNAYHLDPCTAKHALRQRWFDAFELLGGHGVQENSMQLALWTDLLREGVSMPVLGCSDSHTVRDNKLFNNMKTVVFARDNSFPAVREAILAQRTAAVCRYPGEETRSFGQFRLVAYTEFLLRYYFPVLTEAMQDSAAAMRAYCADRTQTQPFAAGLEKARRCYETAFGRAAVR